MIDLFFLTIVMTSELSNPNNMLSEKKADRSPVTIIRSLWYAELCLMMLRCLSSSTYGAVAVFKQKHMTQQTNAYTCKWLNVCSHRAKLMKSLMEIRTILISHRWRSYIYSTLNHLAYFKVKLKIVFIHQRLIGLWKRAVDAPHAALLQEYSSWRWCGN